MIRRFITAATLLLTTPAMAQPAASQCLTASEFSALATYTLPSMIRGTTQRCATQLGAGAYLPRSGEQLAQRYGARQPAAWPAAKAAFLKIGASGNPDANALIRNLPDTSLQPMLAALMEGMVSQRVPLDRCGTIDRLIGLLAPLPPENMAEVLAIAVGLGARSGGGKVGALNLCSA